MTLHVDKQDHFQTSNSFKLILRDAYHKPIQNRKNIYETFQVRVWSAYEKGSIPSG